MHPCCAVVCCVVLCPLLLCTYIIIQLEVQWWRRMIGVCQTIARYYPLLYNTFTCWGQTSAYLPWHLIALMISLAIAAAITVAECCGSCRCDPSSQVQQLAIRSGPYLCLHHRHRGMALGSDPLQMLLSCPSLPCLTL